MKLNKNLMGGFGNQIDLLNTMGGGMSLTLVNLAETPHGYVINVKTPSLNSEAYHVEINQNQLIIYTLLNKVSQVQSGQETNGQQVIIPSFVKAFPLPDFVDKNRIEASFEEGELRVLVPVKPRTEEKPRKIEIKLR
jgi:HSP20 family protein